jgi:hypothetical protein
MAPDGCFMTADLKVYHHVVFGLPVKELSMAE